MDKFEYYMTLKESDVDTWESFEYVEVFDLYNQEDKLENEKTRFGRTEKGLWYFVEPSKFFVETKCWWAVNAHVNEYSQKEFEKLYQKYKRVNKLKRIIKATE